MIPESTGKIWKRLPCPIEYVSSEQAAPRSEFYEVQFRWGAQRCPHFFSLTAEQASKHGVYVNGGVEVPRLAELFLCTRVVAKLRVVKTKLHVAREWDRPATGNLFTDFVAQRHGRSFVVCGVRVNISMK